MTLLQQLTKTIEAQDNQLREYLSLGFLLDENDNLIQESFNSFLRAAINIVNDKPEKVTPEIIHARENLAKIIVGLLQWKSSGIRGKDPLLYKDIQKKLTMDYIEDAKMLGSVEKNKKLYDIIIKDLDEQHEKVNRILDDLKDYYTKTGMLAKSNTVLDISST